MFVAPNFVTSGPLLTKLTVIDSKNPQNTDGPKFADPSMPAVSLYFEGSVLLADSVLHTTLHVLDSL